MYPKKLATPRWTLHLEFGINLKNLRLGKTNIAWYLFGMERKYWITLCGRIRCHAILNYVVFLIIGVRTQIQKIFLISFLELHHCSPSIHICSHFFHTNITISCSPTIKTSQDVTNPYLFSLIHRNRSSPSLSWTTTYSWACTINQSCVSHISHT
jgi:hypothetical protein